MKTHIGSFVALVLAVIALQLFSLSAHAQTAQLSGILKFTAPTTHTDGSPITGPLTYTGYYGVKGSAFTSKTKFGTPLKPDGSVVIPNVPLGTCFQVVATETQPVNVPIDSAPSSEVCLPTAPNGVTNLTVTVQVTVTTGP